MTENAINSDTEELGYQRDGSTLMLASVLIGSFAGVAIGIAALLLGLSTLIALCICSTSGICCVLAIAIFAKHAND